MSLIERVLVAEEQLEASRERAADLEKRLRAVLNSEPESASRALSWISRAENAEKLLEAIVSTPAGRAVLAPSTLTRIEAQLHTIVILKRDQEAMGERPSEEEWWEEWRDPTTPSGRAIGTT